MNNRTSDDDDDDDDGEPYLRIYRAAPNHLWELQSCTKRGRGTPTGLDTPEVKRLCFFRSHCLPGFSTRGLYVPFYLRVLTSCTGPSSDAVHARQLWRWELLWTGPRSTMASAMLPFRPQVLPKSASPKDADFWAPKITRPILVSKAPRKTPQAPNFWPEFSGQESHCCMARTSTAWGLGNSLWHCTVTPKFPRPTFPFVVWKVLAHTSTHTVYLYLFIL